MFGYDPAEFELGRGALSAAGLGFELKPGDVAARGNLSTIDHDGIVVDRRAGRIGDDAAREVVSTLQEGVRVDGVEVSSGTSGGIGSCSSCAATGSIRG